MPLNCVTSACEIPLIKGMCGIQRIACCVIIVAYLVMSLGLGVICLPCSVNLLFLTSRRDVSGTNICTWLMYISQEAWLLYKLSGDNMVLFLSPPCVHVWQHNIWSSLSLFVYAWQYKYYHNEDCFNVTRCILALLNLVTSGDGVGGCDNTLTTSYSSARWKCKLCDVFCIVGVRYCFCLLILLLDMPW